jgi:hypothetical protein
LKSGEWPPDEQRAIKLVVGIRILCRSTVAAGTWTAICTRWRGGWDVSGGDGGPARFDRRRVGRNVMDHDC